MNNNDEQIIKLEKEFNQQLEAQKRYYESEIELLKSKYEFEKEKIRVENENKVQDAKHGVEAYYNVKNTEDTLKLKTYYEKQLETQKNWYEQEIIKRQKETENWHVNNLETKISELKNAYEEMLKAQQDKFKIQEEAMSIYIAEQKKLYEDQLKPYKKLIKIQKKIKYKKEKNRNCDCE